VVVPWAEVIVPWAEVVVPVTVGMEVGVLVVAQTKEYFKEEQTKS